MPLSESEQRILEEMEQNLLEEDPRFARGGTGESFRFAPGPRSKVGAGVFVLGIVILFAFFTTQSLVIGVMAFVAMVAGVVLVLGSARALVNGGGHAGARAKGRFFDVQDRLRKRNENDS